MDWFLYNIDLRHEIVKQYPKRFCDLFVTLGEKFKEILEFLKIIENLNSILPPISKLGKKNGPQALTY